MHAALLTRVRYRCDRQGKLTPVGPEDPDALLELRTDKIEDEYGELEPDIAFPRSATDVIHLRRRRRPAPDPEHDRGGPRRPYQQSLLVTGDRTWQ